MNCPHCDKKISDKKLAKHLASKGGKAKKNFSDAEKKKRAERMKAARLKRWPERRKKATGNSN